MPIPLIVAGVLIAKTATIIVAPEGDITESNLEKYLKDVDTAGAEGLKNWLQGEVDATAGTFVTLHTALVLLQAATRKFKPNPVLNEDTIRVELFEGEEMTEIEKSKDVIENVSNWNRGEKLSEESPFEDVAQTLQRYLRRLAELPAGFQTESCLDTCRKAAEHADVKGRYLSTALSMIRSILGEADLNQARAWFDGPLDPSEKTLDWIKIRLNTEILNKRVEDFYDSSGPGVDETKKALSRIVAMLEANRYFFRRILDRLKELEEEINLEEEHSEFPADLPGEQKDAWITLVSAMYGAIAWRIFHQTRIAVWEAQTALDLADRP